MPALTKRAKSPEKPLSELSDRALDQRIGRARKVAAEISAAPDPTSQELREGKGEERLAQLRAAVETVEAAEGERVRRQAIREAYSPGRLRAAREMAARARKPQPATPLLEKAVAFAYPELVGERLVGARLSDDEAAELKVLLGRELAVSYQDPGARTLGAKERRRYEQLLGKAAGNVKLFAEKRKQAEQKATVAQAKEQLRLATVPPRPQWAQPGSISLPKFVFDWLQDRRGAFTVADLGMLAVMLFMFENRLSLFIGGRFEQVDGEPVLVVKEEHLRFPGSRNNDPLTSGHSGYVHERLAMQTLVRNKWFTRERAAGEVRIGLGEKAKRVREGKTPTT